MCQLAAHDGLAGFGVAGNFAHVDQRAVGFGDDETVERLVSAVRDGLAGTGARGLADGYPHGLPRLLPYQDFNRGVGIVERGRLAPHP